MFSNRFENPKFPSPLGSLEKSAIHGHGLKEHYFNRLLVEEALRHWIEAGELDAAAELVGAHLHAVIAEDLSFRHLAEWLSMFPPGATHGRLPLLVA